MQSFGILFRNVIINIPLFKKEFTYFFERARASMSRGATLQKLSQLIISRTFKEAETLCCVCKHTHMNQ